MARIATKLPRRKRTVIAAACLVLAVAAVWQATQFAAAPSSGTPARQVALPQVERAAPVEKSTPAQSIENSYFAVQLPAGYVAQQPQQTADLLYTQTIIRASQTGSQVVALRLTQLPAGGMTADSSYTLRIQQADRYERTSYAKQPAIVLFSDKETGAVVAFWERQNVLATISVTNGIQNATPDARQKIDSTLDAVVAGWQWRQ